MHNRRDVFPLLSDFWVQVQCMNQ